MADSDSIIPSTSDINTRKTEDFTGQQMMDALKAVPSTGMSPENITSSIMKSDPQRNGVVILGDSITFLNVYNSDATTQNWSSRGYFTNANFMLGWPFKLLSNSGVSGERTDSMLARIDTDVIAYKPRICIFWGGVNDFVQGRSVADVITSVTSIIETLLANGIQSICATVPITGQVVNESHPQEYNGWLKYYCCENSIPLVDCAEVYADISNTVAPYQKPDAVIDEIHPTRYGGYLLGKAYAEVLEPFSNSKNSWVTQSSCATNLVANPLNTGEGGAINNGVAPDNFLFYGDDSAEITYTGSKVNKGSYYQYNVELDNTGSTSDYCTAYYSSTGTLTESGEYVLSVEFGFLNCVDLSIGKLTVTINDSTGTIYTDVILSRDFEDNAPEYTIDGTYISEPITLPADAFNISLKWEMNAKSGIMTIGRHQLMKVKDL